MSDAVARIGGLLPEAVLPLYASMDSIDPAPMPLIQFAHRLIENAAISGGDMAPTTVEQGDLAQAIARAILAETERCAKVALSFARYHGEPGAVAENPFADVRKVAQSIRKSHLGSAA